MSRPDKIKVTRSGGYSIWSWCSTARPRQFSNKDANVYTRLDAPGSIDQLVDRLREELE